MKSEYIKALQSCKITPAKEDLKTHEAQLIKDAATTATGEILLLDMIYLGYKAGYLRAKGEI